MMTQCFRKEKRHPLHVERVRRRDCMVDVEQVLRKLNSRLEQLNCDALSALDLSLSTISTFNLSASPAEGPVLYPRTSSPTENPPGEPAQTSFEQRHPTSVTRTSILTDESLAFVPVTPQLLLHICMCSSQLCKLLTQLFLHHGGWNLAPARGQLSLLSVRLNLSIHQGVFTRNIRLTWDCREMPSAHPL